MMYDGLSDFINHLSLLAVKQHQSQK